MNILAIDTTKENLDVILKKDDKVFSKRVESIQHAKFILPEIEDILLKNYLKISDVDVMGLNIGPGSFTGIRVGITTVKGISYCLKNKIVAVNSFETIAYNHVMKSETKFFAILDARNDNFYVSYFEREDSLKCHFSKFVNLSELKSLQEQKNCFKMFSTGKNSINAEILEESNGLINAVNHKISQNQFISLNDLEPLYLKKSQAEEEYGI